MNVIFMPQWYRHVVHSVALTLPTVLMAGGSESSLRGIQPPIRTNTHFIERLLLLLSCSFCLSTHGQPWQSYPLSIQNQLMETRRRGRSLSVGQLILYVFSENNMDSGLDCIGRTFCSATLKPLRTTPSVDSREMSVLDRALVLPDSALMWTPLGASM